MNVRYHTLPPPPALKDVVRFYWVFEIDGIGAEPYVYRSMADGCAELVFHCRGAFSEVTREDGGIYEPAVLHAQSAMHRRFQVQEDFQIFGAYLYPFALPRLFGMSAAALSNEMPDLIALWGKEGRVLVERMLCAQDHGCRAAMLSQFLLERLARRQIEKSRVHGAIQALIHRDGRMMLDELAGQMGTGMRQMERQFREHAGFTAKKLSRILRFQSTLKHFPARPMQSLTDIALDHGYYDQAHFIHDFKAFSGYAPSEYFLGRPEGIEYREAGT
jgi:methylphosphotriester-DNA--protein-cysteine methyltransferase